MEAGGQQWPRETVLWEAASSTLWLWRWKKKAQSLGMQAATGNWERQGHQEGQDTLDCPEECSLVDTLLLAQGDPFQISDLRNS